MFLITLVVVHFLSNASHAGLPTGSHGSQPSILMDLTWPGHLPPAGEERGPCRPGAEAAANQTSWQHLVYT